jgi:hypothetical protein
MGQTVLVRSGRLEGLRNTRKPYGFGRPGLAELLITTVGPWQLAQLFVPRNQTLKNLVAGIGSFELEAKTGVSL